MREEREGRIGVCCNPRGTPCVYLKIPYIFTDLLFLSQLFFFKLKLIVVTVKLVQSLMYYMIGF